MKRLLLVALTLFTLTLKASSLRPCTPLFAVQEFRGLKLRLLSDYDTHITLTYTDPLVSVYEFKGEKDQATGNWNLKRNGVVLCSLYFGPNAIKIYSYLSGSEEPIGLMPHPDTKFCKTTPVFDKPNDSTLIVKISARTD
jgi:hypothetical protein